MSVWQSIETSRINIVRECEVCKEERDVPEEEMAEIDECDMKGFCTPP